MNTLIFELSMPGCPSWNGKWSGESRAHVLIKKIPSTVKGNQKADELLDTGHWSYAWSDGWRAGISVRRAKDSTEVRKLNKINAGFSGYDWMVNNIISHGSPYSKEEMEKRAALVV